MDVNKLDKFKIYNEKTIENGILMPTKEVFDMKVDMVIKLWPQVNKNGEIDYLIGKGVGVELALLGNVEGREKNNYEFPYRSHSDFEIYDSLGYTEIPESKDFVYVFGSQEFYPKTYTKGLSNLPIDYMDKTYDTVEYKGNKYLIPELELLFLDKYLKQESTPREQGCDAILLLKEYQLNINKINDYYIKYVKNPNLLKFDKNNVDAYEKQINKIIKQYSIEKDEIMNEGELVTKEKIERKVNEKIDTFRNQKNIIIDGIKMSICPNPIKYIEKNNEIDISEENKNEIKKLIVESRIKEEQKYDRIIKEIQTYYNQLYPLEEENKVR